MYHTYKEAFQVEPWREKDWKDLYATGYEYCCVIEKGNAVAWGGLWRRWAHTWEVIAIGTAEQYRGRGCAKAIISAVTGRTLGTVRRSTITTGKDNTPLQRAARAVGFRPISKRRQQDKSSVRGEPR